MFSNTLAVSANSIGDVQLVSSTSAVVENEKIENVAVVENEETNTIEPLQEDLAQTSNSSNANYFAELKKDRDDMYSKSLETYQKIIDSPNISAEQKAIAIQEIDKISKNKNEILVAEELIKLKGFEDVVIYSANGQISVVVRIAALSDSRSCSDSKYCIERIRG